MDFYVAQSMRHGAMLCHVMRCNGRLCVKFSCYLEKLHKFLAWYLSEVIVANIVSYLNGTLVVPCSIRINARRFFFCRNKWTLSLNVQALWFYHGHIVAELFHMGKNTQSITSNIAACIETLGFYHFILSSISHFFGEIKDFVINQM